MVLAHKTFSCLLFLRSFKASTPLAALQSKILNAFKKWEMMMKTNAKLKSLAIGATAITLSALTTTSAFANYYGYQRCMNNGGNWFTCLGELADTMVVGPDIKEDSRFLNQYDTDAINKIVKSSEGTCSKKGAEGQARCYLNALKKGLKGKEMKAVKKEMKAVKK